MPGFWEPPTRQDTNPRRRLLAEHNMDGLERQPPHIVASPWDPCADAPYQLHAQDGRGARPWRTRARARVELQSHAARQHGLGRGLAARRGHPRVGEPDWPLREQRQHAGQHVLPWPAALSPTPYGVGPGPRLQASGPAERPSSSAARASVTPARSARTWAASAAGSARGRPAAWARARPSPPPSRTSAAPPATCPIPTRAASRPPRGPLLPSAAQRRMRRAAPTRPRAGDPAWRGPTRRCPTTCRQPRRVTERGSSTPRPTHRRLGAVADHVDSRPARPEQEADHGGLLPTRRAAR